LTSKAERISLAGVSVSLIGPVGAQLGLRPASAFSSFLAGALVGGVGAAYGLIRAWRRGSAAPTRAEGYRAAALGAIPILLSVAGALSGRGAPRINDVSTDLVQPPPFSRAVQYPDAFKPVVAEHYAHLAPLRTPLEAAEAFRRAVVVARGVSDWELTRVDAANTSFEAVATTRLFRFKDDVAVRVSAEGSGARVDMRSRSRFGKGDLGANAVRIRRYFTLLRPQIEAR